MKKLYLEGSRHIQVSAERQFELEYYLVEEPSAEPFGSCLYSIQVWKTEKDQIVMEETGSISYSRDVVRQMIRMLIDNCVTPMSVLEVVDDLVTLELCS